MAGRPNAELFVEWKTGVPMALADTNLSTFMPSGTSAAPGLVPAPPLVAGIVLFLREDGTWATPSVTALATISEATIIGRPVSAGAGPPQAMTASEATAILNIFVSASAGKKGLVPAPTTSDIGKVLGATGWETPSGGLTRLAGATIAVSTSLVDINLTSYSGYSEIYVQLYGLRPAANATLQCQLSSNGVTYTSASYDYSFNQCGPGGANTPVGGSGSAQIGLTQTVGSTVGKGYNGKIYIMEPGSTDYHPRISHLADTSGTPAGPQNHSIYGGANYPTSMAVGGIRFYFNTTTFAAGKWAIFGFAASA